jgi:hypothetical protein
MSKRKNISPIVPDVQMDDSTGLPLLPPNEFWRITEDDDGDLDVKWMRRSYFGRETQIRHEWVSGEWDEEGHRRIVPTKTQIVEAAAQMVREVNRRNARAAEVAGLLGDYPPKRLS